MLQQTSDLTRRHWAVLTITLLLWLFDGYETFVLLLTIGPSLKELLPPDQLKTLPRVAAYLISITLFGWAVGGVVGGMVGDRIGHRVLDRVAALRARRLPDPANQLRVR